MIRRILQPMLGTCRVETPIATAKVAGRLSSESWQFRRWTNKHAVACVAMCLSAFFVLASISVSIANPRKLLDRERLQGIWVSADQQLDRVLVFKNDELIWVREESAHRWSFKIDETKFPKWLDLSQQHPAPAGFHVMKLIEAIYEVEGDTLTIRWGGHLADFAEGEKQQVVRFKRKTA